MKKNILLISIYYPPIQSIASNRIYSFAKYLDKEKYNILVHTINEHKEFKNNLENVSVSRTDNSTLLKPFVFTRKINKLLHYSKVLYNLTLKRFTKNIYQGWIDKSYEFLKTEIEKKGIDVILSSFAPDATHILALRLKKEFPHLKWVADMRDEMSSSPFINSKQKLKYEKLEEEIFEYCDALTTVSKPILDEFKNMSNGQSIIFKEIRNGYDFDIEKKKTKNSQFTMVYMGNFYGKRNPNNFLRAFSELVQENKIDNFKIRFIGVKTHFPIPENLENNLFVEDEIPHNDAIIEMKKSDCLLLIHPNNGRKGVFTGKLFEYLATLNPIIALVDTEDVAAKLIVECNAGYVSEAEDIQKIKQIILKAFDDWTQGMERETNIHLIEKHHRKEQVKRLEKIIEELVGE